MKFYDLLRDADVSWFDIGSRILELYPDEEKNLSGYDAALLELIKTETIENEGWTLHIRMIEDSDETYADVYMHSSWDSVPYAVDFHPWSKILGTEIAAETFENFSKLDVLCHILWEITFYGYSSEDAAKERERLDKIKESAMRRIEADEYIRIYKEGLDKPQKA